MGIQLKYSFDIDALGDVVTENVRKSIVSVLTDVGMQCIVEARSNGNYMDQTGNLRSSIGFCIVVDGKIANIVYADQLGDGKPTTKEGIEKSRQTLASIATTKTTGICLIVAAGMSYAVYVEGRGRNVLTSSELLAERKIPETLQQLGFKVRKK